MEKLDTNLLGYLGECYVMLELAKRGVIAQRLPEGFKFDLMTQDGVRLEVKTANISIGKKRRGNKEYEWKKWTFRIATHSGYERKEDPTEGRRYYRKKYKQGGYLCDFYVLVCLMEDGERPMFYIIPREQVKTQNVTISPSGEDKWWRWKERWDRIVFPIKR